MANRNKRKVSIYVDTDFFENIFEPERKSLQNKLGINLGQREFTQYLARCNAKISYPAIDKTFSPRMNKRGGMFVI